MKHIPKTRHKNITNTSYSEKYVISVNFAKRKSGETPGFYCKNRKIQLPPIEAPPQELLHYMTRELQNRNSEVMRGALFILSGNFQQTLPVIPKSTPSDEINACLKKSLAIRVVPKYENVRNFLSNLPMRDGRGKK